MAAGCASYPVPGGPVALAGLQHADPADGSAPRLPAPHFPATVAVVRVQAPRYASYSVDALGKGSFSVVPAPESVPDEGMQKLAALASTARFVPLDLEFLPERLESAADLRLAASKIQADAVMVWTLETAFVIDGTRYGPGEAVPLSFSGDADAAVTSAASAVLLDMRTGYRYAAAEATGTASGLADKHAKSKEGLDGKRLEAERRAFTALAGEIEKAWTGIAAQYR